MVVIRKEPGYPFDCVGSESENTRTDFYRTHLARLNLNAYRGTVLLTGDF